MGFQKGGLQLLQCDIWILLNQLRKEALVGHETAMPQRRRLALGLRLPIRRRQSANRTAVAAEISKRRPILRAESPSL